MNHATLAARIDWAKTDGLVPAVVQDVADGAVLMLGYMNEAALERTLASGWVTFFSRSRQRLWTKGETSNNRLALVDVAPDCDNDTLRVRARPTGPVCHLGTRTCFDGDGQAWPGNEYAGGLAELSSIISQRANASPDESYVARLLEHGTAAVAQKTGEEGVELALAAVSEGDEAVVHEAADLFFHTLVLLHARGLSLNDVLAELARRRR